MNTPATTTQGTGRADLDAYVAELVASAPPLRADQRTRLAALFTAPVRGDRA